MALVCDPKLLPGAAACFSCIPSREKVTTSLALLASVVFPGQSAAAIVNQSAQFRPFLGKDWLFLKTYFLAKISGLPINPAAIESLAKCWSCIPKGSRSSVETYLYAQAAGIATASSAENLSAQWRAVAEMNEMVELYMLFIKSGDGSLSSSLQNARCFRCFDPGRLVELNLFLLCNAVSTGMLAGTSFGCQIANAWAARVVKNGGAMPSSNTVAAVCTFVDALNNAGVWSKMIHVNVIAPDSITAVLTPLLVGTGGNDPYPGVCGNNNSTTYDLTINGIKAQIGNTIAENTGIQAATVFPSDTSAGISVYIFQTVGEAAQDGGYIRSVDNAANFAFYSFLAGSSFFLCWDGANGQCSAVTNGSGFLSGNRTAANFSGIYQGSSAIPFALKGSIATTGGTRQAAPAYAFNSFNITGPGCGTGSTKRFSFWALHLGLSAADCQSLFNAVQALRVALGGGFV